MAEMKSLTLGGTKYDSFVDQTAREGLENKQDAGAYVKTVNGTAPDASGNVTVEAGGGGGSGGFSFDEVSFIHSVTFEEATQIFTIDIDYSQWQAVLVTIDVNTNNSVYMGLTKSGNPYFKNGFTLYNGATLLIIPFSKRHAFVSYDTGKGSPYGALGEKQVAGLHWSEQDFDGLRFHHNTTFEVGDKIEVYGIAR